MDRLRAFLRILFRSALLFLVPFFFFTIHLTFNDASLTPRSETAIIGLLMLVGARLLFPELTERGRLWRIERAEVTIGTMLPIVGYLAFGMMVGWIFGFRAPISLSQLALRWSSRAVFELAGITFAMGCFYLSIARFMPVLVAAILGLALTVHMLYIEEIPLYLHLMMILSWGAIWARHIKATSSIGLAAISFLAFDLGTLLAS